MTTRDYPEWVKTREERAFWDRQTNRSHPQINAEEINFDEEDDDLFDVALIVVSAIITVGIVISLYPVYSEAIKRIIAGLGW